MTDGELSLLRFCPFLTFRYWTDLKYLHIFHLIASAHYSVSLHSQRRRSISSHLYVNPLNMLLSRYVSAFPLLFCGFPIYLNFTIAFRSPQIGFGVFRDRSERQISLLLILFLLKNLLDCGLVQRSTKDRQHISAAFRKIPKDLLLEIFKHPGF